jgi:hypothetical protein
LSKPTPPKKEEVLKEARNWIKALGSDFETRDMKKERLLDEWRDAWKSCDSPPSIRSFADRVGIHRQTVSIIFNELVKDGDMIYVENTYVPRPE